MSSKLTGLSLVQFYLISIENVEVRRDNSRIMPESHHVKNDCAFVHLVGCVRYTVTVLKPACCHMQRPLEGSIPDFVVSTLRPIGPARSDQS